LIYLDIFRLIKVIGGVPDAGMVILYVLVEKHYLEMRLNRSWRRLSEGIT
jgi:hypothetical protein